VLRRITLFALGIVTLAQAGWGQPWIRIGDRVTDPARHGPAVERPWLDERLHDHPPFRLCGDAGQICCDPYRGSGGIIGPSHCNEELGCNIVGNRCERPCGQPGQVCCDGPDTVAGQGGPFRLDSAGNFVRRLPMCQGSACDLATRRCVADCGRTAGEACCGPQPSLGLASCLDPSLACRFADVSLQSGTCVACGGLGQISCASSQRCGEGLEEDANGICACNDFLSRNDPVTSTTQCTRWPGRRALCFEFTGSLSQLHTVSGSRIQPSLGRDKVCVEGAFQTRDGTILVDVDNPRIWDGALVVGTERTGEGVFFQAFDHLTSVSGGDGGASMNAELTRVPTVPGSFGMGPDAARLDLVTPGARIGHAPVTLDVRDVQSDQSALPPSASLRVALNPDVLLVPVQVFTIVSDANPGASESLTPAAALALFDRVPDESKQRLTDGNGRVSSISVTLGSLVLDGDARPAVLGRHTLPDDIWAQCGIQFRLVRYTRLPVTDDLTAPRGHSSLQTAVRDMLQAARASPAFLDGPLTVMVAPWCADVGQAEAGSISPPTGQALIGDNAVCVRSGNASGTDLSHELGHILLANSRHPNCGPQDTNLMCSPDGGPDLTAEQCAQARKLLLNSPRRLAFP
jgi:hypothetical protein